jgi:thiol:disulfide interchange protein DsbC
LFIDSLEKDNVMFYLRESIYIVIILVVFSQVAIGESKQPNLSRLQAAIGKQKLDQVKPTPIPGIYEVISGSEILYLTEDGQFVFQGNIIDLEAQNNLTEVRRNDLRSDAVDAIEEKNMVVFAPDKEAQHMVTIFTDIDCGYCRKLHSEIADYMQKGIKVRYLMFPRAGLNSESYHKAVSVWCAEDRQEAMTRAKRGESVAPKKCPNPVQAQAELGQSLGVQGTPSIILESGQMIPGYVPAEQLAQMLSETDSTQ